MVGSFSLSLGTEACGFGCWSSLTLSGRFERPPTGGTRTAEQPRDCFGKS